MFQTEKGQNHHWIWRTTHVKVSTRAVVLNLYSYQNYLEGLFKHRLPGLPPKVSKVEPKIRISNSFPAAEARRAILLWKALHEKVVILKIGKPGESPTQASWEISPGLRQCPWGIEASLGLSNIERQSLVTSGIWWDREGAWGTSQVFGLCDWVDWGKHMSQLVVGGGEESSGKPKGWNYGRLQISCIRDVFHRIGEGL